MNGMNTFSLSSFINASWKIFKRHWKFLVLLWLATGIVQLFLQFIEQSSEHGHIEIVLRIVAMIFVAIISIMISLGWANTTLSLVRQDKGQWSQFETEPGAWLRLIKVSLWFVLYMVVWSVIAAAVFAILGIIGLFVHVHVLAIIGGILAYIAVIVTMVYFALRYQFITYAVLDYPNLTSHQIFKKAGQITKGHLLDLLGRAGNSGGRLFVGAVDCPWAYQYCRTYLYCDWSCGNNSSYEISKSSSLRVP